MPLQTLQHCYGYQNFRSGQLDIINSILKKNDTLAVLPTGGGKSICFQIPGLMLAGTTIVISPLISLMKDQVDTLVKKNITATYINSSLNQTELEKRLELISKQAYKFIYLAPERLKNKSFLKACQKIKIPLIAVDEAHCISMWGHEFRPSYREINQFLKKLSSRPIITTFTATATKVVIKDIINILQLNKVKQFVKSFKRDNLRIIVKYCISQFEKDLFLLRILKKHQQQAGIIYTATRKKAEYLAQLINFLNFKDKQEVLYYHGGMNSEERTYVQEQFLNDKIKLIVATNAFGMGVDKANIRFIIHYQIPGNIENYYQEAGRAGRDRKASHCYLLFQAKDLNIQIQLIKKSYPDAKHPRRAVEIDKLKAMLRFASIRQCRQETILEYFTDKKVENRCANCDICLNQTIQVSKKELSNQKRLLELSQILAQKNKIPQAQVMSRKMIQLIALLEPQSKNDFLKIAGIGHGWVEKWYSAFSSIL
ncbi:MAG: RecQ family ATP-dependent DNA helicase [Candidatus Woesebacteria bacterium]|jgi:ATP-dependent DNA helicase RecQ